MKSRTLTRPMFRIGGSAGTGITSGLDQPRKELRQGTNPYAMNNFAPGTLPGFLTGFGLDLLSRPPAGNIFQTAALSARGPFRDFQSANMARTRAQADATREATRMAAFQPQEELNRFADITTGIMGGMRGTGTTTTNIPNPTPLQTALGVGTTLAGIYGGLTGKLTGNFNFN